MKKFNVLFFVVLIAVLLLIVIFTQCNLVKTPSTSDSGSKDTTNPVVIITNPSNGMTIAGTKTIIAIATDNEGIKKVDFYINDIELTDDPTSPYEYSWDTSSDNGYGDGTYTIKAKAYDTSNNTAFSDKVTVTVDWTNADMTNPTVNITSPANGTTISDTVTITADATDNDLISKVDFYINNVCVGSDTSSPYTYSWDTTEYSNGSYTLKVQAFDNSANYATDDDTSATVNNSMPTFTLEMIYDMNPTGGSESTSVGAVVFNNKLYYQGNDGNSGNELYVFDGINDPTLDQDINSGGGSSFPLSIWSGSAVYNNKLYFAASDDGSDTELWEYDGTTLTEIDINPTGSSSPRYFTVFNTKLYFRATNGVDGTELFSYDGINDPTMDQDINSGGGSSSLSSLTVYDGKLYFNANNGSQTELWEYDGTTSPTMIDINPGAGSSAPGSLTVFNNKLCFSAEGDAYGIELWSYDGTDATRNSDIHAVADSNPSRLTVYNNKLYFRARDTANNFELWKYDGANEPTLVYETHDTLGSYPTHLTVYNNKLFFRANDGTDVSADIAPYGEELWRYDGINAPTVIDINKGGDSDPFPLGVLGDNLIFYASDGNDDGTPNAPNGWELWKYKEW